MKLSGFKFSKVGALSSEQGGSETGKECPLGELGIKIATRCSH